MAEIELAYAPLPIHIPFHQAPQREKLALGAVGSGKTIALCADAIAHGLQQPGSRIMVARKTITRLKDTTEREFLSLLNKIPKGLEGVQKRTFLDACQTFKNHGHVDMLVFPNGTEYIFRSLEEWAGLMSLNLAGIYIDEASEVQRQAYDDMLSRLRQYEPTDTAQRMGYSWGEMSTVRHTMAMAANPNGHNWIWDLFIRDPNENPNRVYFRSSSFDNPYLYNENGEPGDYLMSLLQQPKAWQDRYVWCRDDAFAGQILVFDYNTHVTEPFTPPKDWERAMGLDWGMRSPTACVWWAKNPHTHQWVQYREWQTFDPTDRHSREAYVTATVHDVARKIIEIEQEAGEVIRWRAADPQIAEKQASDGKSIDYWFRTYGIFFQQGLKHHEPRINALNSMLANNELAIQEQCGATIVAFQQYRWEEQKLVSGDRDAPERPRKKDDHLVDASQYLATIFVAHKKPEPPKKVLTKDEEYWMLVNQKIKGIAKRRQQARRVR